MNEIDIITRLARMANMEQPPRVDVAEGVLEAIVNQHSRANLVYGLLAGLSTAGAAAACIMAFNAFAAWQDPLNELLRTVMQ